MIGRALIHAPPRRGAVVSTTLLVAAGLLVAAPVMAQSSDYNFESDQVRPLVLSPSRGLPRAANTGRHSAELEGVMSQRKRSVS